MHLDALQPCRDGLQGAQRRSNGRRRGGRFRPPVSNRLHGHVRTRLTDTVEIAGFRLRERHDRAYQRARWTAILNSTDVALLAYCDELGARSLGSGPRARLRFSLAEVDERSRTCSQPLSRARYVASRPPPPPAKRSDLDPIPPRQRSVARGRTRWGRRLAPCPRGQSVPTRRLRRPHLDGSP